MSDQWSEPVTVEEMYGDWDYLAAVEVLGRSLDPRPSTSLFDTLDPLGLGPGDAVLDIGGREAGHSLVIAERFGCRVVAVDPVEANIARAAAPIAEHTHGDLVEARLGSIERIPAGDDEFDVIFSRDMLAHIEDLDRALAECTRVLRAGGAMVIHQVFATELLEPREALKMYADCAVVAERMSVAGFEDGVAAAGFSVESLDVVGSEWAEASQEAGTSPNYLLQVARLRRAKADLIAELGEAPYRAMYVNALWSIYQMIGKLESRVYVLRLVQT